MAVLVQHLLLASIALIAVFLIAIPVRRLLMRNAIARYRIQAILVVFAAMLLPIQFLSCESFFQPRRTQVMYVLDSPSANSQQPGNYHQFDSARRIPSPVGTVPEHDQVSQGSFASGAQHPEADTVPAFGVTERISHRAFRVGGKNETEDTLWSLTNTMAVKFLGAVYLAVVFSLLLILLVRVLKTTRLVFGCSQVTDRRLRKIADATLGPRVNLMTSPMIDSPACLVVPRKMILFPSDQAAQLNDEELRCVLVHEATHLERNDWIVCCFEQMLSTVLWFNPLARLMVQQNKSDREQSCDAHVVRQTGSVRSYAKALLACCEPVATKRSSVGPLVSSFSNAHQLKRRLGMLEFANRKTNRPLVITTVVLFVAMFALGGVLHAKLISVVTPESVRLLPWNEQAVGVMQDQNVDTDGDGLTDFHERHKYLTSPDKADSDGDGIKDGDWRERREYQYTVRSVVQVLRPVTIEYLNDDFQDARVLDETDEYVELEVVHYPFNRVAATIKANDEWRDQAKLLGQWTEPGPSSDWTPAMQKQLKAALLEDGIDVDALNDHQIVQKVSRWLCDRAEYVDGFTTFVTAWDESGKPFIPDGLGDAAERELKKSGLTIDEQWQREVSAKGMFENKTRGSCTSSAIYLNGCLKAVGIPTRTVLCIPLIDASDEREFDLVRNIKQPAVRKHLLRALKPLKQSWSSHTFNEVFVGNRWYRLNYSNLGQGIYDQHLFGMITHVATFNDWADAKAHETVGKRQKIDGPRDVFGFRNPYSAISLRDEIGVHCKVELPEVQEQEEGHLVKKIFWTDDESLPEEIRDNCRRRGRFGFIAEVSGVGGTQELIEFMEDADLRVFMNPQGDGDHPQLKIGFDKGCFWAKDDKAFIYVAFGAGDKRDLVKDVEYSFEPRESSTEKGWQLKEPLKITRKKDIE